MDSLSGDSPMLLMSYMVLGCGAHVVCVYGCVSGAGDISLCQLTLQPIDFSAPLALMNDLLDQVYLSQTHTQTHT